MVRTRGARYDKGIDQVGWIGRVQQVRCVRIKRTTAEACQDNSAWIEGARRGSGSCGCGSKARQVRCSFVSGGCPLGASRGENNGVQ